MSEYINRRQLMLASAGGVASSVGVEFLLSDSREGSSAAPPEDPGSNADMHLDDLFVLGSREGSWLTW